MINISKSKIFTFETSNLDHQHPLQQYRILCYLKSSIKSPIKLIPLLSCISLS